MSEVLAKKCNTQINQSITFFQTMTIELFVFIIKLKKGSK